MSQRRLPRGNEIEMKSPRGRLEERNLAEGTEQEHKKERGLSKKQGNR